MMQLKKSQVRSIDNDLIKRGVHYPPLREDLLDHICTRIETSMDAGMRFKDAYKEALDEFLPHELEDVQDNTTHSLTSVSLVKSYLLTAHRNLVRHKAYTFINVFGLTLSLAVCTLIFIFLRYEVSYDTTHPEDNLYRLNTHIEKESGVITTTAFTGAPWGPAMVEEIPELLDMARIMKYRLDVIVTTGLNDKSYYESNLIWGDQQLLQFFDIPFKEGSRVDALKEPHSVVISESVAKKYFGHRPALGQTIQYNNEVNLKVTGVIKDMPENMHFKADLICSFSSLNSFWSIIDNWNILYYHTYFKLDDKANIPLVVNKFPDFFSKHIGSEWVEHRKALLQKVDTIHLSAGVSDQLKAGSNIQYLYILALITVILLCLACANFVNLNVARALKRTKEVGIRKVMGGLKLDLIHQFILESGLLTACSLILALILAQALLPYFNDLLGKELQLLGQIDVTLIGYLVGICALVSIVAGIFPGLRAATLGTLKALKGGKPTGYRRNTLGDGLVLFQFVICTVLMVAIGTIRFQQIFILEKDLGYSKEQMLMLSTTNIDTEELELARNEVLALPAVQDVSITSHQLAGDQPYYSRYVFNTPNTDPDTLGLSRLHIDEGFIDTYQLTLLAGRNYNKLIKTDTASFLINERTASILSKTPEQALDLTISYYAQGSNGHYLRTGKVIGVVQNFHFESLHHEIEGMVMDIQPDRAHFIACRLNAPVDAAFLANVEQRLEPFIDGAPLDYFFMDDQLNQLYSNEEIVNALISIASSIALVIAFLGLIGLVAQLTSYKRQEIGLRKVLGANILSITTLLSQKYLKIISLSLMVGLPIAYFWMQTWLQQYPYRIDFPLTWAFLTGLIMFIAAFGTIILITFKETHANPISALKEE